MRNTDYIDLSESNQPFEGLVPAFGKNMGEGYMVGKRSGATDYLEVIDCEAVKDYIAENVKTPEHEGQFASFEGFISETALKEEEEAEETEEQVEEPKEEETEEPKEEEPVSGTTEQTEELEDEPKEEEPEE
jgi:hypothetical protein